MKQLAMAWVVMLLGGAAFAEPQDEPKGGQEWLRQLVGEWEYDSEVTLGPDAQPIKVKGTESIQAVGSWIIAENKAILFGMPFTGITTVGYDAQKKQYVGTWIDSMHSNLMILEGALDPAVKALTLSTEAPNPAAGGKLTKFKDVHELKSKDHRTMTSSMQGDDGKWVIFQTATYQRKK